VITVAISIMKTVAFMLSRSALFRSATHHKPGIQRYKARAALQIETLFERVASFDRNLGKAVALACIYLACI
jgi:CO/xanthine dehydrogenase Mo-binding subunit